MIPQAADPLSPPEAISPGALSGVTPGQAQGPTAGRWRAWREMLGWSATSVPVGLLLVGGIVLGPRGINLLPSGLLASLDPVVPVALAALGVLVGLGVAGRRPDDRRVLVAASVDAALTMLVVSVGIGLVSLVAMSSVVQPLWLVLLAAGVSAATSLTLPTGDAMEPRTVVTRVTEFGVLLPVVAGALLLAWLHAGSAGGAVVLVAQASGVTLALAAAGWLLLTRASSETEERVFAISALLLVGGAAAALSLSALFGGLVSGVFWRYAGRHPRATISRDVLLVQHPLVVLVLLVAGARVELAPASLALGAGYLLLRIAGRLAGGLAARRVIGVRAPGDLGSSLLPPGVFGVAFALNTVSAASAAGADVSILLGAVVTGSIGAELAAVLLRPGRAVE